MGSEFLSSPYVYGKGNKESLSLETSSPTSLNKTAKKKPSCGNGKDKGTSRTSPVTENSKLWRKRFFNKADYKTSEKEDGIGGSFEGLKEQFQTRMFLLEHEYPGLFHKAKMSRGASSLFLAWRVFSAVFNIALLGVSIHLSLHYYVAPGKDSSKWLIYLTNWALLILTLSTIDDIIGSLIFYFKKQELLNGERGPMPWYVQVFWVEMNIVNAIGLIVSLVYWTVLHDYSLGLAGYRILPFLTHGVNIMYIVVNLFVVAMPVRLLHFYHASIFFAVYMVFNAVYVLAGGTDELSNPYIYGVLDWNKDPGWCTGIAILGVFLAAVAHVIMYMLYVAREKLYQACRSQNGDV